MQISPTGLKDILPNNEKPVHSLSTEPTIKYVADVSRKEK